MTLHGQRDAAKFLARALLQRGIDGARTLTSRRMSQAGAGVHQHAVGSRLESARPFLADNSRHHQLPWQQSEASERGQNSAVQAMKTGPCR
jgi:hypothetical protein